MSCVRSDGLFTDAGEIASLVRVHRYPHWIDDPAGSWPKRRSVNLIGFAVAGVDTQQFGRE
jgi:hypothetical protein